VPGTCASYGLQSISTASDCAAAISSNNVAIGAPGNDTVRSGSHSFYPTGCTTSCYSSSSGYFCQYFNTRQTSVNIGDNQRQHCICSSSGRSQMDAEVPAVEGPLSAREHSSFEAEKEWHLDEAFAEAVLGYKRRKLRHGCANSRSGCRVLPPPRR